jgi:hypothetical protein
MRTYWLCWLGMIIATYGAGQAVALATGGPMLSDVIREFSYRHPVLVFVGDPFITRLVAAMAIAIDLRILAIGLGAAAVIVALAFLA